MQVGASFGGLSGLILDRWLPSFNIQPGLYALCAATAMLGGVFRSSISLVGVSGPIARSCQLHQMLASMQLNHLTCPFFPAAHPLHALGMLPQKAEPIDLHMARWGPAGQCCLLTSLSQLRWMHQPEDRRRHDRWSRSKALAA